MQLTELIAQRKIHPFGRGAVSRLALCCLLSLRIADASDPIQLPGTTHSYVGGFNHGTGPESIDGDVTTYAGNSGADNATGSGGSFGSTRDISSEHTFSGPITITSVTFRVFATCTSSSSTDNAAKAEYHVQYQLTGSSIWVDFTGGAASASGSNTTSTVGSTSVSTTLTQTVANVAKVRLEANNNGSFHNSDGFHSWDLRLYELATVGSAPTIGLNPTSLSFTATQGGSNPANQTVAVNNTGGGTLNWSAAVTAGAFLSLSGTTSGVNTGTITAVVNISGLGPGTYNGNIRVTAAGASNTPRDIAVTLTVNAPPPAIGLNPTSLSFTATQGGSNPANQTVAVNNTGGGTLNWSAAATAGAFLSLSGTTSGVNTGTITAVVNISGLGPGTYNGNIRVTAAGASNTPQDIAVTLTVNAPPPAIGLNPTSLSFTATQGGSNPASQTVAVNNTGGGTLNWSAAVTAGAFLSLSGTTSGVNTGTITAVVNISGLGPGTYNGNIRVTAAGASNTPRDIAVILTAAPQSPAISGTFALVTNQDLNTVTIIDLSVEPPVRRAQLPVGTQPIDVELTPDGRMGLVTNVESNSVSVIDLSVLPPMVSGTVAVGAQPLGIGISADGRTAVVGNSGSQTISILDLTANPPVVKNTVTVGAGLFNVAAYDAVVTADDHYALVALASANLGTVAVVDLSQNPPVELTANRITVGSFPILMGLDPSRTVAVVNCIGDNKSSVIDLTSFPFHLKANVAVGVNPGSNPDVSPSGLAVVPNSSANTVSLINTVPAIPVVTNTLAVGTDPRGAAIIDASNIALIANRGDSTAANQISRLNLGTLAFLSAIPGSVAGGSANHIAIHEGPALPPSDLRLSVSVAPNPVATGSHLTFTAIVENHGPSSAPLATVTDALPAGFVFVSASSSVGSCTGTSIINCNLGTLANGASATITIVVTPTTAGGFTDSISVMSSAPDPNTGNNLASAFVTVVPKAPSSVSVTPNAGSGSSQTFSLVFSHPNGYTSLSTTYMLINSTPSWPGACYTYYDRNANTLWMLNDLATVWMGPVTPGAAVTVQNSQCSLSGGGSSVSGAGNNLTVNLTLTFKAAFGGMNNVYLNALDSGGVSSNWQQLGSWTVPVAGNPTLPFGSFDTPVNGTTGVVGAIPVTGWALDNLAVNSVDIWREPVTGEPVGNLIFVGNAVFVVGARPDVQALFPSYPYNYRAGWGYQMLTNFLPNSSGAGAPGNGTYKIHAIAHNKTGGQFDLGTKTIVVDNAHTARPFGTLDTPAQGGMISGADSVDFGWTLTPQPGMILKDGSTITVVIDGVIAGHPTYDQFRSDIASLFPGLANSMGAVGFFHINTTTLANGVHTISWNVFDNLGRGEGLGSRYFNVLNTGSGSVAVPQDLIDESVVTEGVHVRHGLDVNRQPDPIAQDADGGYSLTMEEVGLIELRLGAASGHLLVEGQAHALPIGSTLRGGIFYWQPGPGFLGDYTMQFERPNGTKIPVRVNIIPKRYSIQ